MSLMLSSLWEGTGVSLNVLEVSWNTDIAYLVIDSHVRPCKLGRISPDHP